MGLLAFLGRHFFLYRRGPISVGKRGETGVSSRELPLRACFDPNWPEVPLHQNQTDLKGQ